MHKNSEGKKKTSFIKKYPFFAGAIVVAIIIVALFGYTLFLQSPDSAQMNEEIKAMHLESTAYFDYLTSTISTELGSTENTSLDTAYLLSMQSDIDWLREKESAAYNSFPAGVVYGKEIAVALIIDTIVQLNQDSAIGVDYEDYSAAITSALEKEAPQFKDLNYFMDWAGYVDENGAAAIALEGTPEEALAGTELNALFREYFSEKKAILVSNADLEKKYVEAKKVVMLYYSFS